MANHHTTDKVWEHGLNAYPNFSCNYCRCTKKGGGVTWFKQYLAARGSNVKHCGSVPPDVRDYFRHELDRTAENRRARQRQSLLREVGAEGNVVHDIDLENDEELQCTIHVSREEAQYAWRVREQGGQYEHGGGSSQQPQSGGFFDRLRRTTSRKGKSQHVQTRIDTGSWTSKSKQTKSTIGKAYGPSSFTPKPYSVQNLTIHTSLWYTKMG
jgi:hypothetical protein